MFVGNKTVSLKFSQPKIKSILADTFLTDIKVFYEILLREVQKLLYFAKYFKHDLYYQSSCILRKI